MQELKAEPRTQLGRQAKIARAAGFLPAVVYGEGVASQAIAVPQKEFEKIYHVVGESTLVELKVNEDPYTVLIHDISYHPLTSHPTHADFYAVRMDKVLRVKVPLEFAGESSAVKNEGGVLVKVVHELEIEALPANLPHTLPVDLSRLLALDTRILISDISPPQGVKILASPDEVIAIVEAPRSEEELAALNETVAAPLEVKTEAELKKEVKAKAEATVETSEKNRSE